MRIGVPREIAARETRVALVPDTVARLIKSGFEIVVETAAGGRATFPDASYVSAGATIAPGPRETWSAADAMLCVRAPRMDESLGVHQVALMREGAALIGFLRPARHPGLMEQLAARRITAFGLEAVPRISRAQKMDALSSMSTVAGYKAVLLAADTLGQFFPLLMTAAGTLPPAKVFVLGAGVAGLQAIATARRLGAVVEAFDVRPAVREEVQSLGATFVGPGAVDPQAVGAGGYAKEMSADHQAAERALLHKHVAISDVVVTTAMVPDKQAPVLITEAMVKDMKPGSVIVDLSAEMGGNCELTEPNARVVRHGVVIHGPVDLVCEMPVHASQMYSRNIAALLTHLTKDGALALDFDDEITRGSCLTHEGRPLAARVTSSRGVTGLAHERRGGELDHPAGEGVVNPTLLAEVTIFALAVFLGFEVISKVPVVLHTPLMSGTNAIHGIVVIGGILVLGNSTSALETVLGLVAVLFGGMNFAGGFVVTDRMLEMFKKKPKA